MNCLSILVTVVIINWNFRGPRTHKMPNWIRVVFLKYLPVLLFMKRPKKTRLRWMMDMPGVDLHFQHFHPSFNAQSGIDNKLCDPKNKTNIMEIPDLPEQHHPNCTIAAQHQHHQQQQQLHQQQQHQQQQQQKSALDRDALRDNESVDMLYLTPEAYRAAEAIEFISEHLKSEDEYIQVIIFFFFYYYDYYCYYYYYYYYY